MCTVLPERDRFRLFAAATAPIAPAQAAIRRLRDRSGVDRRHDDLVALRVTRPVRGPDGEDTAPDKYAPFGALVGSGRAALRSGQSVCRPGQARRRLRR